MPPAYSSQAKRHAWPKIQSSTGVPIKATQRDLRRYRSLKTGLARLQASPGNSPVTPTTITPKDTNDPFLDEAEEREVVEPLSWTALAYNGFMWWASAGEQARSEQAEESARDAELLADLSSSSVRMEVPRSADLTTSMASLTPRHASTSAAGTAPLGPDEARVELAIIAYFHRLTTQTLTTLAEVVESSGDVDDDDDDDDDDNEEATEPEDPDTALLATEAGAELSGGGRGIRISSEEVSRMGLDVWSETDAEFVKALAKTYFERSAYVEGKGVEVCGVRVC